MIFCVSLMQIGGCLILYLRDNIALLMRPSLQEDLKDSNSDDVSADTSDSQSSDSNTARFRRLTRSRSRCSGKRCRARVPESPPLHPPILEDTYRAPGRFRTSPDRRTIRRMLDIRWMLDRFDLHHHGQQALQQAVQPAN